MRERNQLKEITAVFLEEKTDYLKLAGAIKDYKRLLTELSEIEDDDAGRNDMYFENGKALGTTWAAMCIDDLMRTKRFIKGLYKAVQFVKKSKKGPIYILYAGSGPFAALILPLICRFSESEIQFTLLEINPQSYAAVQKVISRLGFEGYIQSIENVDATIYVINKTTPVDIVLSETMQLALKKEQQVPIMINLLSQLPDNVIMIPQKIVLALGLLNSRRRLEMVSGDATGMYYKKAGNIFELNKKSIAEFIAQQNEGDRIVFPEITIQLTPELTAGYNHLAILTEIQVFEEERLYINESGISLPLMLNDIEHINNKKITIKLQYKIDAEPGVLWQLIPTQ
jgi:predicted RNA methylase